MQVGHKGRAGVLVSAMVLLGTTLAGSPAAAAAAEPAPPQETLVFAGSATVETWTADHRTLLSTVDVGPATAGRLLGGATGGTAMAKSTGELVAPMDSGSGGTSSASGCRKVTVNNVAKTLLGFTAYKFHTWTDWCWNRTTKKITSQTNGWFISEVDSQHYWRGIVNKQTYYYAWASGYGTSGYYHYRQGQFDNCVLKYGCIGTYYPTNTLRSHSDGTWTWATAD